GRPSYFFIARATCHESSRPAPMRHKRRRLPTRVNAAEATDASKGYCRPSVNALKSQSEGFLDESRGKKLLSSDDGVNECVSALILRPRLCRSRAALARTSSICMA